jgi:hypothetical protein
MAEVITALNQLTWPGAVAALGMCAVVAVVLWRALS